MHLTRLPEHHAPDRLVDLPYRSVQTLDAIVTRLYGEHQVGMLVAVPGLRLAWLEHHLPYAGMLVVEQHLLTHWRQIHYPAVWSLDLSQTVVVLRFNQLCLLLPAPLYDPLAHQPPATSLLDPLVVPLDLHSMFCGEAHQLFEHTLPEIYPPLRCRFCYLARPIARQPWCPTRAAKPGTELSDS